MKTSSRHVLKTSSTRLQRNNFTSSKTSWKRLEDVLKTSCKTSWRHVLKTSWIHYGDKQNTYWGYLYLTNLNVYLTNLYLTNLHLTILKRIQNALSRTIISIFVLFLKSRSISISRIKISDDCMVLWNQLNSNSTLQKRWRNKSKFLSNMLYKHI